MSPLRNQYIELRKSSAVQIILFLALFVFSASAFFRYIGIPGAQQLFAESFHARLEMEGDDLNLYSNWRLTVEPPRSRHGESMNDEQEAKIYYYNPIMSILPVVIAFGFLVAGWATSVLSPQIGYVRQKIEREIINALHHYARIEFSDHTDKDLIEISDLIRNADIHRLHELEEHWNTNLTEIEALQAAIRWRERTLFGRVLRVTDAWRLYLRNHFTIRYENPVLGFIYIGAAILIIIIGLRGLQFIPKDRPSLVLFAISLEFILLIVYAVTLIYTKESEQQENEGNSMEIGSFFGSSSTASSTQQAEKLLRMFVSTPVERGRDERKINP